MLYLGSEGKVGALSIGTYILQISLTRYLCILDPLLSRSQAMSKPIIPVVVRLLRAES